MEDDDEEEEEDEEEDGPFEKIPPRPRQKPSFIVDIGCGSGLSGDILTEAGHHWIGVDISGGMLGLFEISFYQSMFIEQDINSRGRT
jgi:18S rRNA (guanine1575-N7)-methyltransferase